MERRRIRFVSGFVILAILMTVLFIINLMKGSADISARQVLNVLAGSDNTSSAYSIIFKIRLPRIIAAVFLGGALSVSGFLLQNFFNNPIAGPFVLGISSGAKLVVAFVMIFFLGRGIAVSSAGMITAAFIGSMISMGFILLISGRTRKMSMLIICGIMTGYICSAITDLAVAFADDSDIVNLHNWSMGTFSATDWEDIRVIVPVTSAALILTFFMSKPMGAYQLGEAYAENMGVNIRVFRLMLILMSSILSACVTAFAGPVSFVGVAVPHLVKNLFGTAKPIVIIPASFLGGAAFCLLCDLIARTVFAPVELSISTVTAVFGAPVVIWIMLHRDKSKGRV